MQSKPMMLYRSELCRGECLRVYATSTWQDMGNGHYRVTGRKEDVTQAFKAVLDRTLDEWIDAGYIEITPNGANFLNKLFGRRNKAKRGTSQAHASEVSHVR